MNPKSQETYVVGIDLGTTNSGIAYWDEIDNRPILIQNIMNEDVTPSVIAVQDNDIIVGKTAKSMFCDERIEIGKVATSHKRDMGTPTQVLFNGEQIPPYILGSYVLKALKRQAEDHLGCPIERAVITVPAYFAQSAVEDTKRAGEKAGFEVEALLPEPTAAALAFGQRAQENTRLMVYDLGGGTFDISIIEAVEGQFVVRANGGDRYLGGDDFDTLLRDYILKQSGYEYLLNSNHPKDQIALNGLRIQAEETKIRLSTAQSFPIRSRNQFFDSNNKPINIDLLLTRATFEMLIEPKINETIDHCLRTLKKVNVEITDINEILMVGGSTRIPFVSTKIEQKLGIKPNKRLNPITCVTEGAAIHTRSLKWILEGRKLILEAPRKPLANTKNKNITFLGKLQPKEGYEDEIDLNQAKIELYREADLLGTKSVNPSGGFVINTELKENSENNFQLKILNSHEIQIDKFTITIVHNSEIKDAPKVQGIDNMTPFPFSVGLVGQKKIGVLLDEQTPLPAKATKSFALAQDQQTELLIPIYEGKDPVPERNRPLSEIRIYNLPENLNRGDEVHVSFEMDGDRILHVQVNVPKASIKHQDEIHVGMLSRDHEIEKEDPKKILNRLRSTLESLEDEIKEKLPLVPPDKRENIGTREGRLKSEANEALQKNEIGKLEAKIDELVNLTQEVNAIIPNVNLTNEFRENAQNARNLVQLEEVTSVDSYTIEQTINAGEAAIERGDNDALLKQNKELERLLGKIYDNLRSKIKPEQILISLVQEFEKIKMHASNLIKSGQFNSSSQGEPTKGGIIDQQELQTTTIVKHRSSGEIEKEITRLISQGNNNVPQVKYALQSQNQNEIQRLIQDYAILLRTIEGLLS